MDKDSDDIDFKKLAKELDKAVEADSKYSRENAAKFRAVEQRVGSYEEFRDIVLASNLKPLDKKDIMSETNRHQPLNSVCTSRQPQTKQATGEINNCKIAGKEMLPQPQNPDEFMKSWKKLARDSRAKYTYLMQIEPSKLEKIFKSEQVGNILGEILSVLDKHFSATDLNRIIAILRCLKASKRFALSVQFLTKAEKGSVAELFEKLETNAETEFQIVISGLKAEFMP